MTPSRSPLLLALLAALAGTARAADAPPAKDLAPVKVEGAAPEVAPGTSIQAFGDASLHGTPASVTVVTRRQLDDRQIRSISELAREDASLGDNYAPVGYYQDTMIRGYALDLATGFRQNDLTIAGEQRIALEDKQQVQVLKGLAGIDAGVMEPGGVLDFVTKRPADVRDLTLGTDSHGSRYAALDAGGWLTPSFGVRANLAWEDIHSYVEHADGRRNFYALAADWRISPDATLRLDSNYQASAQRSVSGYQLLGGDTVPQHADPTRMLGFEPWQQPVGIHSSNTGAHFDYRVDDAWALRLAAGHSRSVIGDNVAFAYGCFYAAACADGAPGNFFAPNGDYDVYDYRSPDDTRRSDEARATLEGRFDTAAVAHRLTLGVDAFRHTVDLRPDVYDYVGTANIAERDPPWFAPSPNQPGPSARRLTSWQRAAFAMDRLQLGETWQLVAGARLARLHERAYDDAGTPTRDTRIDRTLPQAALLWQPTGSLTTYLSYSEALSLGLEAPWWTSNAGSFLAPRQSRQVEAGVKYDRDALSLSAALYRIRQPYQFALADDSAAGFTFLQRGREVHTGLELGAHGRVTGNLRIDASLSMLRARAQDTGAPTYEGHQVVNVPRLRAALYADYRLPFLPALAVLGGWRYASPNVATLDGRVRVPAYNVFDAGLRYRTAIAGHATTWRLSVDNVFDRFYWRDTGAAYGDLYLFPGAPRLARLSVTVAFR